MYSEVNQTQMLKSYGISHLNEAKNKENDNRWIERDKGKV